MQSLLSFCFGSTPVARGNDIIEGLGKLWSGHGPLLAPQSGTVSAQTHAQEFSGLSLDVSNTLATHWAP